jgi:leucyl aminopeptidase
MKKIDIFFINNIKPLKSNPYIKTTDTNITIIININNIKKNTNSNNHNLFNYRLAKQIQKISDLIYIYDYVTRLNIVFGDNIDILLTNNIITKLSDILYRYYPITREIKLYNTNKESVLLMEEITKYKNIVMDPNKNPNTYLEFVKSNVPQDYKITCKTLIDDKIFPLTYAVGLGSNFDSYFVHISPSNPNPNNFNVYLIGKAVTYDSGGLNIKLSNMEEMKIDMTGSAIILTVLRLLKANNFDSNLNIHLLIPIVENMISSKSIKPGTVIETMGGKKVEIVNTDAEGRLCIVDCIDWVNKKLITDCSKSLIIDIATLTGNTLQITSGISSIIMSNNISNSHVSKLLNIGEKIGEYLDYLKIRKEYSDLLISPVADIKNINMDIKAGCIIGGTFINYFTNTNKNTSWIHIDLGVATFVNSMPLSYGVNLLYEFLKQLNKKID